MAISDVAQEYTPGMFWKQRSAVAAEMEKKLVRMLRDYGYCQVTNFQLLHVKFPDKFEDMVTDIQLQVQSKQGLQSGTCDKHMVGMRWPWIRKGSDHSALLLPLPVAHAH